MSYRVDELQDLGMERKSMDWRRGRSVLGVADYWATDIRHVHSDLILPARLQSLQAHAGFGFYSWKGKRSYFLSYENFRENNIPGGWNDDWSGQFELLRSQTYDNSDHYIRMNLTYESPLLLLSWLPWAGHYMEMERFN